LDATLDANFGRDLEASLAASANRSRRPRAT